jgi:hypothetical protein
LSRTSRGVALRHSGELRGPVPLPGQFALKPGGWIRAVVPIESVEHACRQFLALGPDIEMPEPPGVIAMARDVLADLPR